VLDAGTLVVLLRTAETGLLFGRAISFTIAFLATWALNHRYTFRPAGGMSARVLSSMGKYLLSSLAGLTTNLVAYGVLVTQSKTFAALPWLAVAIGSVLALFLNFVLARRWAFSA